MPRKKRWSIKFGMYLNDDEKVVVKTLMRTPDNKNLIWNFKQFRKVDLVEDAGQTIQMEWADIKCGAFYSIETV